MAQKYLFSALAVVMMSMLMSSCGNDSTFLRGEELKVPDPKPVPVAQPLYYEATADGELEDGLYTVPVIVNFDNDSIASTTLRVSMETAEELYAQGDSLWVCTDSDEAEAAELVEFRYNYGNNKVRLNGLELPYFYNGKTYILSSRTQMQVICRMSNPIREEKGERGYYGETRADYALKSREYVLAEAATVMVATEDAAIIPDDPQPEYDHTEWSYNHTAFRRSATLSNGIITVLCDNVAKFADVYSDGSQQNKEEVSYIVSNKFTFNAPAMEVNSLNEVVGKTFNFSNGVATVAGYSVKAEWTSANVEGSVMHNGRDYASEIAACRAAAKNITFNSKSEAVVKFYDNDAKDFAEVLVPVKVSEKITLKNIDRKFVHKAFRKNATVSGKTISVICDNEASFVKEYSDGSKDAAEKVAYTVTNKFAFRVPSLVVENMSSVLNKTYSFNNGTAVVEGKNVTVTFSNRVVGDIMFEGKNYKSEALKCEVEVKNIKITSASTAIITFEGEGETITAEIPVSIVEAEEINGEIKAAWATDSYNGRTLVRTDLHILAEKDGAYVVYSRPNRDEAWTITNLSAAEGQSVIASGRALAWIWNGADRYLGTVEAQESASAGYTIQYYLLDERLANNLGKSESTLNGKKFENPIHGEGALKNGMWTISYDGATYYFVNK